MQILRKIKHKFKIKKKVYIVDIRIEYKFNNIHKENVVFAFKEIKNILF
jgi:hypothetical protein